MPWWVSMCSTKPGTTLFEIMQKAGKARFYWDYDQYYANPYRAADRNTSRGFEAGLFIEENLRNFPNALPAECFDNFRNIEQIEMVSATSEAAQAQSVSGWLNRHLPGRRNGASPHGGGAVQ